MKCSLLELHPILRFVLLARSIVEGCEDKGWGAPIGRATRLFESWRSSSAMSCSCILVGLFRRPPLD
jgi:hypothetical protein